MNNKKEIFIPFIDGILNYNCRECDSGCCQVGDMKIHISEKKALVKNYPHIEYFLNQESDEIKLLHRFTRCWFLGEENLCLLQKNQGYRFKPLVCRLFPFYICKYKNGYIALPDLNCILYADEEKKGISRSRVLKDGKEAIKKNMVFAEIDLPSGRLCLEKKILAASKEFLGKSGYLDFAAFQMSAASGARNKDMAKNKSKLKQALAVWKSFLGVGSLSLENESITHELTAFTPLLRLENPHLRAMSQDVVPMALTAIYFYACLIAMKGIKKISLVTFRQILYYFCFGLLLLEKEDLMAQNLSLEDKAIYLHKLHKFYIQRIIKKDR